jgi:hypothetical protein
MPISTFIRLVNLILINNTFKFGGHYYHQIQGTAMGTKMALSYANLFMADMKQHFLKTQPK